MEFSGDINRINEISIESYEEKVESNVNANFIKEGIGTHHMTTNNNFSAIDIKKFINRFFKKCIYLSSKLIIQE